VEPYLHDLKDEQYDAIVQEYLGLVDSGIAPASAPKDVLIIGAGMSGLIAGSLLRSAGHNVRILEGQDHVGGRVKTLREEFTGDLYGEAGAMRFPSHHLLLQKYIDKLGLERRPFFNVDVDPATLGQPKPTARNNEYLFVNGVRMRRSEYMTKSLAGFGYHLPAPETGRTAEQLLDGAIGPLRDFVNANQDRNWPIVVDRFDELSVRRFFKDQTVLTETAIELIGLITNLESRMPLSFLQSFIEAANINATVVYSEIVGGCDLIPRAFLPELEDCITFNARVEALDWEPNGSGRVRAHVNGMEPVDADEAIVAIPFSALRFLDIRPRFSHAKTKAIRELHYDSATKVLLEFNRRFWEEDDDIYGGGTVTDLPNRFVYYPYPTGTQGGVVLAAYCWSDDAQRWESLRPETRLELALHGLSLIHGDGIKEHFVGGASTAWMEDPFALGEAAIFAPGQLTLLQPRIALPEGNVHFAGEHTSIKHAWIEGAIESGIRTALEVNGQDVARATPWRGGSPADQPDEYSLDEPDC
jgi:monoamine oxidase